MLKIGTHRGREPVRVDLGGGAAIYVKPADAIVYDSAVLAMGASLRTIAEGGEALADLGIDLDPESLASSELRTGLGAHLLAVELGRRCITRWEGIGDADGNPIPVPDRKSLSDLFLVPGVMAVFERAALASPHQQVAVPAEGVSSDG